MIDNVDDIAALYNKDPEREHNRLERHQLEFDVTWRYLMDYLPPQGNLLEIGAATGRYTLPLAKKGYTITAVDLSEKELEHNAALITAAGLASQVTFIHADARDLSAITATDFDAVLLMGPLYHLIIEADRQTALRAAYNHLKPGGNIFTAFISRFGIMGELLKTYTHWIEDTEEVRCVIEHGHDPVDYPKGGFRGYFATVDEIAPLHEGVGFDTLIVAGMEPGISADDESYNQLEGQRRQLWLDLFYEVSTEKNTVGASRHLLYIGKK